MARRSTSPGPPWRSSPPPPPASPQRPRYATDADPSYGTRREPFLPGPAAFERPNHVVQAAFAQAIAARNGKAAAPTHDDIPSGRDTDFDDSTDAESRAIARRFAPANVERPAGSEPQVVEMPIAERASSTATEGKAQQPVRRPRAGRAGGLSPAVAQPPAPPRRDQSRPGLHPVGAARHGAPA